jgi:hypothetical protein
MRRLKFYEKILTNSGRFAFVNFKPVSLSVRGSFRLSLAGGGGALQEMGTEFPGTGLQIWLEPQNRPKKYVECANLLFGESGSLGLLPKWVVDFIQS